MNWIDLTPFWDKLHYAADQRERQKSNFASRCAWTENSNFPGLCGEQALAIYCDHMLRVNYELLIEGDGGSEFENCDCIDVKGARIWRDPYLKEVPANKYNPKKQKIRYYVLAGVDIPGKRAWLPGFTIRADMFRAPRKPWGHGPMHSIKWDELQPIEALKRIIAFDNSILK